MKRRKFAKSTLAGSAAALIPSTLATASSVPLRAQNKGRADLAAYYFRGHMYTCVPRQIREDMEWMAEKGTSYVCPAVIEQDLFAAQENLALITEEAERAGMRILAVPSRWGGLTAGAPKIPSLFSVLNPHTWLKTDDGRTGIAAQTSGVISSIHHPDTLTFFCETLKEMYRQHPSWAGMILDEPKAYRPDYSTMALKALGPNAPHSAHLRAASRFYSEVCKYTKEHWPDKMNILFIQANKSKETLEISAEVKHLDYFGADGRPWGLEDDEKMKGGEPGQESGTEKVLLSGNGDYFISLAQQEPGRKSFFLLENHNLKANMMEPMDRNYPAVLSLAADMFCYYYYPRNVEQPERAMELIGRHLKRYSQGR